MKTAIYGFAGSGKSELFRALAGPDAQHTDRAMVKVPEPRLDPLTKLFSPRKVTPSEIEYVDIPGGSGKGHGLGQRVQSAIRPHDCLVTVLDAFSGLQDPEEQYRDIETDLMITDMAVIEKRLERLDQDKKKDRTLVNAQEEASLLRAKDLLDREIPLRQDPELAQTPELRGFCFLTAKPVLYVWNVMDTDLDADVPEDSPGQAHVALCAKLERELAEIDDPEERGEFLEDLGLTQSALDRIITRTSSLLGLITFLTAGEKEVRAWKVTRGATAPEAAGVIHSDLQKGFIRAEVLSWEDFCSVQNFKQAKDKGLLRLEGKDYLVRDGDIITFRFNV
ncbi:DUF933 domain-containing protein [Desulfovermiculus halophilus]|jgi:hypothetical protein|uniref:DUF933 domain-containing protein n=1 Tax=Desulfovermiculus halophilus TaxID=339722 RepID=UPI000488EC2B|nr:DUF933 domain-containing protein [Desulfovermiculus halophilus]